MHSLHINETPSKWVYQTIFGYNELKRYKSLSHLCCKSLRFSLKEEILQVYIYASY